MADINRLLELVELVGRKIRRRFQPLVEAEGVSVPELFVLRKVHEFRRCRVTELADEIGIPPSTLTGIIDRLVGRELLRRGPDPEDRRAVLLEAGTKLGPLMQRVQRMRVDHLAGVFGALPPGHLEQLVEDLEKLHTSLEQEEE